MPRISGVCHFGLRLGVSAVPLRATVLLALVAVAPSLTAQSTDPSGRLGFVILRGTDTLGIERATLHARDSVTGTIVPTGQPWVSYLIRYQSDGRPAAVRAEVWPAGRPPEGAPLQRITAVLAGDSVQHDVTGPNGTTTRRVAAREGVWLLLGQSFAELQSLFTVLRPMAADSVQHPMFAVLAGASTTMRVRFHGADSAAMVVGSRAMLHFDGSGAITRVVQAAGGVVTTRMSESVLATSGQGRPDYSAPPGAPYSAEEVRVPSAPGVVLAGTLTRPLGLTVRVPAVVTISGSGPQDRDSFLPLGSGYRLFRQIADTLGRSGVAVLRLDDRGTGESTGSYAAATVQDLAADVQAAVRFLRARPEIDPDRIALVGHSLGGVVGPLVAASDARVAALVLMAAPAEPRGIVLEQNRLAIAATTGLTPSQRDSIMRRVPAMLDSMSAASPAFASFLSHDAKATARRVRTPVLVMQGSTDSQIPAAQAGLHERFLRDAGNRSVTVRHFTDRNHLFLQDPDGSFAGYGRLPSMRVDTEVLGVLVDWLRTRLLPGSVGR
jgi:alpha-beta hydrolase superfamily lysophospholipase